VIDSMLATIAKHGPGSTKQQIADALKVEEVNRGLTFEYCLIAAGSSHNRAPSEQRWEKGDVLSVDSGGNYHGYIGDLARMAILGEPDAELEDLLGEIEATQRVAMKPIRRVSWAVKSTQRLNPTWPRPRFTITRTFLPTAWGWSAMRRRA
jgi:Xaa-Pro aminopeptidase